jgi:hypothetical protein
VPVRTSVYAAMERMDLTERTGNAMLFKIASQKFRVVISKEKFCDEHGAPCFGRMDPDRQELLLSPDCPPGERRRYLKHEFLHAFKIYFPAPAEDEAATIWGATWSEEFDAQFSAQGGLKALAAMRPTKRRQAAQAAAKSHGNLDTDLRGLPLPAGNLPHDLHPGLLDICVGESSADHEEVSFHQQSGNSHVPGRRLMVVRFDGSLPPGARIRMTELIEHAPQLWRELRRAARDALITEKDDSRTAFGERWQLLYDAGEREPYEMLPPDHCDDALYRTRQKPGFESMSDGQRKATMAAMEREQY